MTSYGLRGSRSLHFIDKPDGDVVLRWEAAHRRREDLLYHSALPPQQLVEPSFLPNVTPCAPESEWRLLNAADDHVQRMIPDMRLAPDLLLRALHRDHATAPSPRPHDRLAVFTVPYTPAVASERRRKQDPNDFGRFAIIAWAGGFNADELYIAVTDKQLIAKHIGGQPRPLPRLHLPEQPRMAFDTPIQHVAIVKNTEHNADCVVRTLHETHFFEIICRVDKGFKPPSIELRPVLTVPFSGTDGVAHAAATVISSMQYRITAPKTTMGYILGVKGEVWKVDGSISWATPDKEPLSLHKYKAPMESGGYWSIREASGETTFLVASDREIRMMDTRSPNKGAVCLYKKGRTEAERIVDLCSPANDGHYGLATYCFATTAHLSFIEERMPGRPTEWAHHRGSRRPSGLRVHEVARHFSLDSEARQFMLSSAEDGVRTLYAISTKAQTIMPLTRPYTVQHQGGAASPSTIGIGSLVARCGTVVFSLKDDGSLWQEVIAIGDEHEAVDEDVERTMSEESNASPAPLPIAMEIEPGDMRMYKEVDSYTAYRGALTSL